MPWEDSEMGMIVWAHLLGAEEEGLSSNHLSHESWSWSWSPSGLHGLGLMANISELLQLCMWEEMRNGSAILLVVVRHQDRIAWMLGFKACWKAVYVRDSGDNVMHDKFTWSHKAVNYSFGHVHLTNESFLATRSIVTGLKIAGR